MFDDYGLPDHVDRVNAETASMFVSMRYSGEALPGILGIPNRDINMRVAWEEFDKLAYSTIFKEAGGDIDVLYDPNVRVRVIQRVRQKLPLMYFLRVLSEKSILRTIENQGSTIYFIPDAYKDEINAMLKASSTAPR